MYYLVRFASVPSSVDRHEGHEEGQTGSESLRTREATVGGSREDGEEEVVVEQILRTFRPKHLKHRNVTRSLIG